MDLAVVVNGKLHKARDLAVICELDLRHLQRRHDPGNQKPRIEGKQQDMSETNMFKVSISDLAKY